MLGALGHRCGVFQVGGVPSVTSALESAGGRCAPFSSGPGTQSRGGTGRMPHRQPDTREIRKSLPHEGKASLRDL